MYEEALKKTGYSQNHTYIPNLLPIINKNCKCNIIWLNLSTTIGKWFLNLVDHHFHHNLHKVFNRNSIKQLHANMKDIINSHKHHILKKKM